MCVLVCVCKCRCYMSQKDTGSPELGFRLLWAPNVVQVPWKSSTCSSPPSHLSSLFLCFCGRVSQGSPGRPGTWHPHASDSFGLGLQTIPPYPSAFVVFAVVVGPNICEGPLCNMSFFLKKQNRGHLLCDNILVPNEVQAVWRHRTQEPGSVLLPPLLWWQTSGGVN